MTLSPREVTSLDAFNLTAVDCWVVCIGCLPLKGENSVGVCAAMNLFRDDFQFTQQDPQHADLINSHSAVPWTS